MAVGGYQAQIAAFHLHQQAVEIIADVLHGHGVLHLREHVAEGFLRQGEGGNHFFTDAHQREIFGRQGLQCKAGFAGLEGKAVLRPIQRHNRAFGQGAQDVLQFFGIGGDAEVFGISVRAMGMDLDFQIGGQNIGLPAGALNQHVGENRQGVLALHNAGNGLQRFEQGVALGF